MESCSGVVQILGSLINFTKTNFKLFLYDIITTLTSIQARTIFFKDISCLILLINCLTVRNCI